MSKRDSEATRRRIVEQTADLLNTRGYLRTSMTEIMRATGLQKGGIYHHFSSREELVMETFQYSVGLIKTRVGELLKSDRSAKDKLSALITMFKEFPLHDVLRGGCPIVNLAVESDASFPRLRAATQAALALLTGAFERVIVTGIESGDFVQLDAPKQAAYFVASLEGGLILATRHDAPIYLTAVADALELQVRRGFA
jgi:AcrR family transcriptional regulator